MCNLVHVSLFVLVCFSHVLSVPLRLFFPYGESRTDIHLQYADDVSSPEIQLQTPIHYYDGFYTSIFVNSNGHLSFESELPAYQPTLVMPLGLEIKLISAFMADIDLTLGGHVFYRETTEVALLQRAAADIQGHFSEFTSFEPLGLFIATWDDVVAYKGDRETVNTFQIVIASDELNSFTIINYLDDGIQWIQSEGKFAGIRDDPPAQAGFDSGSKGLHLQLPNSGTTRVQLLASESNVNLPGVWMYQIGNTKGSNVQPPDLNTGDVVIYEPELDKLTCHQEGTRRCHEDAICVDYSSGFCCSCVSPDFGNGEHCINPDTPQRLNGKVSGTINGVTFENLDMHAFVVTKDGRAYTAISRVPDEISSELMTLNTIGGIIGWMFALIGGPGTRNGYMYTGGLFNRTARIRYQEGQEVIIEQKFYGHNVLNNIRMETVINGTVPDLSIAEKITVDDYSEEYTRVRPGEIHSTSQRTFHINNVASKYTWDQVIRYDECAFYPRKGEQDNQRLSVTRNFVIYDTNDKVVRFAMSNKISRRTGVDPCQDGAQNCDENADCIPQGDIYSCDCKTGFVGDGNQCSDVDECELGLDTCDDNAICFNSPGSFQCRCNAGYRGDGRTCIRDVALCGETACGQNSHCVFNDAEQRPMCECNTGYYSTAGTCQPISFACNEADICHDNAECVYHSGEDEYSCECMEGFSGDGLYCDTTEIDGHCDCDEHADCVLDPDRLVYYCICKRGYTGTGQYCTRIRDTSSICDDCHPNANCVVDHSEQRYRCQCSAGYQGDGLRCEPYDCHDADICDANAVCAQDSYGNYICSCNAGYRGDGRRCVAEGCNVLNNCGANAQCLPDPRDTSRYLCRCNPGYSGNGQVCIRRVVPCNEVDNCSEYGQCVYDPSSEDYRCRCNRGYEGDGFSCRPRGVDCRRDSRLCDPNASCLLNVDTFVCVCNQGFRGDGTGCQAMQDKMNYLLFSRGYSIHKVSYKQNGEDSDGSRVLYVPDELAVGVAADCSDQTFYWTDVSRGGISRANLQGFDKELVTSGFNSPEGIAIDWLARNIYVTDSGLDIIAVLTVNGTHRKTLISEDVINPRAIVLDPQRGVMYWTDWYRNNPTIERAYMDGTEREVFVDTDLGLPNGLTIDYYTQQICWGDAGTNKIECIRSDGVGRTVITEAASYPFDLTLYGNTIYWSDWTIRGVPSVHIDGSDGDEPLTLPVGGNGRIYGIASVGEFCPRVTNACLRSNGGCRYLCLPTPNGGRTCACPDDVDDITCSEIGIIRKK